MTLTHTLFAATFALLTLSAGSTHAAVFPSLHGGPNTPGLSALTACPNSSVLESLGTSIECIPLSLFSIQAIVPNPPRVGATASGTSITVTIRPSLLDGGTPLTSYSYSYGTTLNGEGATSAVTLATGTAVTGGTFTINGLAGTTYYGKVYSSNAIGMSGASNEWSIRIAP